ncbi:hypothetical protein GO988_11720 [Hymenobacter sp. HMF4947]|uniref:Uncharacterized protein n=1 Tax=Hymenobacter ginkgonis TaxID=2682976 RepID=A0A7K1TF08_9BACT|nr:hypothetical protein [Hymenobacter ginkgonis]MVN76994.1 hypothetical protein [Hymenobacter ginkgonis]
MNGLLSFWLLAAGLLQAPPAATRLDVEGGVGGVRFGEPATQIVGFARRFTGVGRRWRTTRLYSRPADTTQWHGVGPPTAYWFRQNRFIGVDIALTSAAAVQQTLQQLSALYGPARPDTLPNHWYWLGQRSYLLLELNGKKNGVLFVASLAMLNEQVYETAVRARARRQGWQPDSLGLPRQFLVR